MCKKLILSIIMMLTLCIPSFAQEAAKDTAKYVLVGKTFTDNVSNSKAGQSDEGTKTEYTYQNKKGENFPILLSKTGKAFYWTTSQKTGKRYRRYLPEIGRKINPKAYENANNK
jgi:hypothetical protein